MQRFYLVIVKNQFISRVGLKIAIAACAKSLFYAAGEYVKTGKQVPFMQESPSFCTQL